MTTPTMTQADVDLARFLAETSGGRKPRKLRIPDEELARRAYDHETERLRRFIRGQQIIHEQETAA